MGIDERDLMNVEELLMLVPSTEQRIGELDVLKRQDGSMLMVPRELKPGSSYVVSTIKSRSGGPRFPVRRNLNEWLEAVTVHRPGSWDNDEGPKSWYAISSEDEGGIVAYIQDERDAFRYRLDYINRKMNG